jgi:hypothetical protein
LIPFGANILPFSVKARVPFGCFLNSNIPNSLTLSSICVGFNGDGCCVLNGSRGLIGSTALERESLVEVNCILIS